MNARPRLSLLATGVGIALAQWGAGTAFADSAVGVDTALGNAMNPPGRSAVPRPLASDGFDTVRRSPTGQLYGLPYDHPAEGLKVAGWQLTGGAELGVLGGDAGIPNALFRKYKDLRNGAYLDYFELEADKADTASFIQAFGGGTGRDDQFYGVQFGRYNDWKVKLFYNETAHVFTTTYKRLYDGAGTGTQTLAGGLKPLGGATPVTSGNPTVGTGACTPAAPCWRYTGADGVAKTYSSATALTGINWTGGATVAAGTPVSANSIAGATNTYLATVPGTTELGLVRQKGGAQAEIRFTDHLRGYASYAHEQRKGERPFSINENNYNVEIAEPIDYVTHDFLTGLSYTDALYQANLRASASVFHNNISTLTVDQPFLGVATGIGAARTTTIDLYPDNQAYNLKGEFARSLPDFYKGRLTFAAAWSSSQQNDKLLLPVDPTQSSQIAAAFGSSIIPGINNPGYAINTLDLRNWDGTNGSPLSQSSANQRIDTRLFNLSLSLQPNADLSLKADARHQGTVNRGGYLAYNPLTGQFGRGFRNSSAFDLVVGSAGEPGAINVACLTPAGFAPVAGCRFNGNLGGVAQSGSGTVNAVTNPAASTNNPANVPITSPARDIRQTNLSLAADWDLGKGSSLNGLVEREEIHRSFREREKTWEDKVKLGYINRGFEEATLRLSFEESRRSGSPYAFWPVEDFGTGLSGLNWDTIVAQYFKTAAAAPGWTVSPANLAGYLARYAYTSRKSDQADRDQRSVNARVNFLPRSDLDLGVALQYKEAVYPDSGYGLEKDRTVSSNIDLNYQPSSNQQFYGYYSWQNGTRTTFGNAGTNAAGANNGCTFPVGTVLTTDEAVAQCAQQVWLAAAAWSGDTQDRNEVLGAGFQTAIGSLRLGVDYSVSFGKTSLRYGYGPNVLTAPLAAAAAASPLTDISLIQNTLSANLLIPIQPKVTARLFYRYEAGRVRDWHYAGVPIGASAAENQATVQLDAGAQNYRTNVFGVLFQFQL
jgi:hypothetical protein